LNLKFDILNELVWQSTLFEEKVKLCHFVEVKVASSLRLIIPQVPLNGVLLKCELSSLELKEGLKGSASPYLDHSDQKHLEVHCKVLALHLVCGLEGSLEDLLDLELHQH